jgi:hypothetical protein
MDRKRPLSSLIEEAANRSVEALSKKCDAPLVGVLELRARHG